MTTPADTKRDDNMTERRAFIAVIGVGLLEATEAQRERLR